MDTTNIQHFNSKIVKSTFLNQTKFFIFKPKLHFHQHIQIKGLPFNYPEQYPTIHRTFYLTYPSIKSSSSHAGDRLTSRSQGQKN